MDIQELPTVSTEITWPLSAGQREIWLAEKRFNEAKIYFNISDISPSTSR